MGVPGRGKSEFSARLKEMCAGAGAEAGRTARTRNGEEESLVDQRLTKLGHARLAQHVSVGGQEGNAEDSEDEDDEYDEVTDSDLRMDFTAFSRSLFALAAVWCRHESGEQFAAFLSRCLDAVSVDGWREAAEPPR